MRLLDRYILGDIVRLTLLTTGILVVVIAFGAALRPLSEGMLLSVGKTFKYVLLVSVPMLQFALPFAAGFAATISLHRRTSDNEILVASAAGVSYARVLRPVVLLGLALMLVMIVLTQWVIPRFWIKLEQAIAVDVVGMVESTINRGDSFVFDQNQIHADRVVVEQNPEGTQADARLVLLNVTAVDLDDEGRIDREITARQAAVDVYRELDYTYLKLVMADAMAYDPQGGGIARAHKLASRTLSVPTGRAHDTQQWTQSELLALRRNPDLFRPIDRERRLLVPILRAAEIQKGVAERLRGQGTITLSSRQNPNRRYVVHARDIARQRLRGGPDGTVEIVEHRDGRPQLQLRPHRAELRRTDTGAASEILFDLVLTDCEITHFDAPESTNRRRSVVLESLAVEEVQSEALANLSSTELVDLARQRIARSDPEPPWELTRLEWRLDRVQNEIIARLSMRYALSITTLLLVLLGAVLAMWRRESLPLTIYLWAFLPALANLLLVTSGEDLIRNGSIAVGELVVWSGNIIIVGFILFAYFRLSRC